MVKEHHLREDAKDLAKKVKSKLHISEHGDNRGSATESAVAARSVGGDDALAPDDKDAVIASLLQETRALRSALEDVSSKVERGDVSSTTFYASSLCRQNIGRKIPRGGLPARFVESVIEDVHLSDFNPRLNTSSYVNVVSEEEERRVAAIGAEINIADASVYPASIELHDRTVDMLADLWHCPAPAGGGNYAGAGTVGSTEACLLAGLALKFRWRKWYAARHSMTEDEVIAVRPNLVMSSCYQAAWEKLFRYFDVKAKLVKPTLVEGRMAVDPGQLMELVDEQTIGVVGILGNHYNGMYDPVWEIDEAITKLNAEKGWQVGLHIDAASGGFIAPFQEMSGLPCPGHFDFRLPNVLSMSASGHKFGESICGTGWIVFRQREDLAEHIAVTVTYLGGHSDSMTLNFSRPASGPYVQFYKLLRLGTEGYQRKVENQMLVAKYIRNFIAGLVHAPSGKKRFQLLDGGDTCCLPVVAARLNPELGLHYNDIDVQHAMSESHWYVSGYSLGFENPATEQFEDLFTDVDQDHTMFRVVVKSNLTMTLAEDLTDKLLKVLDVLDSLDVGYQSLRSRVSGIENVKKGSQDDVPIALSMVGDKRLSSFIAKGVGEDPSGRRTMWGKGRMGMGMSTAIVTQHIC